MKDRIQMGVKKCIPRYLYVLLLTNYKKIALVFLGVYLLIFLPIVHDKEMRHLSCSLPSSVNSIDNLLHDKALTETSYLVPNYVHFYRFGSFAKSFNLIEIFCLLAVYRNQQPDRIYIHTDDVEVTVKGFSEHTYGRKLLTLSGFTEILHIVHYPQPEHVFGIPFSTKYRDCHITDLARLRILRKFGGIFLDNDVYLSKNINTLRKQELAVLTSTHSVENYLIVSHKDSRFLSAWITSYMKYDPKQQHHHTSETFLHLLKNFTPKPFVVRSGVVIRDMQTFMTQDIPEFQTGFAIKITQQLQTGSLQVANDMPTNGKDFIDKYFGTDEAPNLTS